MTSFISNSADDTWALGSALGRCLSANSIIYLYGDLGAGKTTFIKGLAGSLTDVPAEEVNSPTFTYLNIYKGTTTLYHFDLYRLKNSEQFLEMGFDEFFFAEGVCCVEWTERIAGFDHPPGIRVQITFLDLNRRLIEITGMNDVKISF